MKSEVSTQSQSGVASSPTDDQAARTASTVPSADGDFDELIQRGTEAQEQGHLEMALAAFATAVSNRPDDAIALNKLGAVHLLQGNPIDAEGLFRRALVLQPEFDMAFGNLGLALEQSGRNEQAEAHYRHGIESGHCVTDAVILLNRLLVTTERLDDAVNATNGRIERGAASALELEQFAGILLDFGYRPLAEHYFRHALALSAGSASALMGLARLCYESGRLLEAESSARRVAVLDPGNLDALGYVAGILDAMGRFEEAEALCRLILEVDPDSAQTYANLAHFETLRGRWALVDEYSRRALELGPELPGVLPNAGVACIALGKYDEAESFLRRELALRPENAMAKANLGYLLLQVGKFAEGWAMLEARWDSLLKGKRLKFDAPEWDGRPLRGRLLIHSEQGYGDTMHLVRYAILARELADEVVVVVQQPLQRLLEDLPGLRIVTKMPKTYDAYCYMMSLPLMFRTEPDTIPARIPYLSVPMAARRRWQHFFEDCGCPSSGAPDSLKVGVVWAGRIQHGNDSIRSMEFATLAPLFSIPNVQWVSLQKDRRPDEVDEMIANHGWIDPMADVQDYEDTAAVLDQLDLVICVDTSIAHLAGGMGKKVWLMLPANPDWRWLLSRPDDSPWYPTMTLFRQTTLGDWTSVIERVRKRLAAEAGAPVDEIAEVTVSSVVTDQTSRNPALQATQARTADTFPSDAAEFANRPWMKKLQERFLGCPFWYHRIQLPGGIETPGWMPIDLAGFDLPERLDGLRVLDIGAWDGYWTFEALKRGAREVVAIDDFSDRLGVPGDLEWRNWENFDVCREALGFDEDVCARKTMSVYDLDPDEIGRFDVVFLFGVFNQLRHPLLALEKIASICDGSLYVEAAILDGYSPYRGGPGHGYESPQTLLEYYPGSELASTAENRWAPTLMALTAMVHASGFFHVEAGMLEENPRRISQCRGFVSARKAG